MRNDSPISRAARTRGVARAAGAGRFGVRLCAPKSQKELLGRAWALGGHTLGALGRALGAKLPSDDASAQHTKGFVGRLIEDALGADVDAGERPDFVRLGIELKTVPVRLVAETQRFDAPIVPQESPFLCSIDMLEAAQANWQDARLKARLGAVLFVPIERAGGRTWAERRIFAPRLWRPSAAQWAQIRADWELLMGAIGAGHAGRLSARLGEVVQVRPKAANSRTRTLGHAEEGIAQLLPLGFYLRRRVLAELLATDAQR